MTSHSSSGPRQRKATLGPVRAGAIGLAAILVAVLGALPAVTAAPRTPSVDTEVLERLPARATESRTRELAVLRAAWRREPSKLDSALPLARRCLDEFLLDGDPRRLGCAQAALAPWWREPDAPQPARLLRAIVLQFSHRFDAALADLDAVLRTDATEHEAWSWRVAILMVQARYTEAREACARFAPLTTPLSGIGCKAQVDAATGASGEAVTALREALRREAAVSPAERVWVLTRLAETEERRGDGAAAEAAYREAIALDARDVYLQAAYADFLLDQGRAAEVKTQLAGRERVEVLLLRLALAAKQLRDSQAPALARELATRFAAARRLGDALHEKEEARFVLVLQGDAARALALARANFAVQREPADARVLLEAALAARDKAAAEPALRWLADSRIEAPRLRDLAARIKELP